MASTDLLFSAGANPTGSPVEIVFGDDGGGGVGTVSLRAAGRITGLRGHVPVRRLVLARATGRLSGLRGAVPVAYDVNVARPMEPRAPRSGGGGVDRGYGAPRGGYGGGDRGGY